MLKHVVCKWCFFAKSIGQILCVITDFSWDVLYLEKFCRNQILFQGH